MEHRFLKQAFEWIERSSGKDFLEDNEYCATRDIFQVRLDRMRVASTPLLTAVMGEFGNNSFDHNVGNWRDVTGVYFAFDDKGGVAVVADRGQGVYATLSRVEPTLADDIAALETAFTKQLSGRSPERRGNGLKFVRSVAEKERWSLQFFSGSGKAVVENGNSIQFHKSEKHIQGCIAFISL
jgi:hypothetical protein